MMKPEFFRCIARVDSRDPAAEFYLIRDIGTLLAVRLTWQHGNAVCHFEDCLRVGFAPATFEQTLATVARSWTHTAFVYLAMLRQLAEHRVQIVGNYYVLDVLSLRRTLEK
jgi:hypothetical protein